MNNPLNNETMRHFIYLKPFVILLACFISMTAFAQKTAMTGVVLDTDNQEPLIGVTVMEKGTTNGTMTDIDGRFSISVNSNATLVFSYVGYTNQEVSVKGEKNIVVKMASTSVALDEMVVIGYGVQRKSDITGSISSVSGKDINDVPVSSALQALQGKAAGVNIIQNTGAPGSNTTIKIRGTGTVMRRRAPCMEPVPPTVWLPLLPKAVKREKQK